MMGGGKTTVVGPMLALMLADGNTLVVQTMPQALLEQSKATLRATFSAIMRKRVFTLVFERSSELGWETVEKLHSARHNRGVVLCTGSTIKALQLKLLEKMDVLRDTRRKQHPSMEVDLRGLVEVMRVYQSSCLIMDEVDLLLHPLKSELNFPIGKKHALDLSPQRWQCAIHCCDAVFYAERKAMSVSFEQSSRAKQVLEELCLVIEEGYEQHTLQRSPHLTLLNEEWYVAAMKPIMARWMLLWLEANHVSGLRTEYMEAYITRDCRPLVAEVWGEAVEAKAAVREAELSAEGGGGGGGGYRAAPRGSAAHAQLRLHAMLELKLSSGELTGKAMQLVNLTEEWLSTFLPHCLQKIDRVSFGLLSAAEVIKLQRLDPHSPRSRLKLAIPFLGKDVPSTASEFAHPDIIIGLTVLAYRYEGLRKVDFEQDLIALVRSNFESESGPYKLRPSSLMYNSWVEQAGGRTKGQAAPGSKHTKPSPRTQAAHSEAEEGAAEAEEDVVVPLWLLKQSNEEQVNRLFELTLAPTPNPGPNPNLNPNQVNRLFELLRKLPTAIHWCLTLTAHHSPFTLTSPSPSPSP